MRPSVESEWLQPGEVCIVCGRTTPAKIEQHHVAGHANDRELTVGACRRDGSYCHEVLTEQQRARGVPLEHFALRTESQRMASVFGGFTDVCVLAMRHLGMTTHADELERLGDDGTRTIFEIDPPAVIADRVVGPDPRGRDRRLAHRSSARTSATRWRRPRIRKSPRKWVLDQIDRIRFDAILTLWWRTARAMLGDVAVTRRLQELRDRSPDIRRGLALLATAEKTRDCRDAIDALRRNLIMTPFDRTASEDEQGRVLLANVMAADEAFSAVVRFYVALADAQTAHDAAAALDELITGA